MNTGIVIGLVAVGLVLFAIRYGSTALGGKKGSTDELLKLCRGDKDMAERLIAREQSKNSKLSRTAAASAAVYALKRDNR